MAEEIPALTRHTERFAETLLEADVPAPLEFHAELVCVGQRQEGTSCLIFEHHDDESDLHKSYIGLPRDRIRAIASHVYGPCLITIKPLPREEE